MTGQWFVMLGRSTEVRAEARQEKQGGWNNPFLSQISCSYLPAAAEDNGSNANFLKLLLETYERKTVWVIGTFRCLQKPKHKLWQRQQAPWPNGKGTPAVVLQVTDLLRWPAREMICFSEESWWIILIWLQPWFSGRLALQWRFHGGGISSTKGLTSILMPWWERSMDEAFVFPPKIATGKERILDDLGFFLKH